MRVRPIALVLGVLPALAAGCAYHPGSFHEPMGPEFAGERVTVGCLDVAVARHDDAVVEGPAIAYEFGNSCDAPARVDLGAIVVTGRTTSGREVAMYPYDPDGVIRPGRLEARRYGREIIEYRAPVAERVVMACVDVAPIAGDPAVRSRVVCVDAGAAAAPARPTPDLDDLDHPDPDDPDAARAAALAREAEAAADAAAADGRAAAAVDVDVDGAGATEASW